jgi:hypothetical protein
MVRFSNTNIAQDYYPFGMLMPGRSYSSTAYKYGFNKGSEKDDEIAGLGNHFTTFFREGDTRLATWWGVDPKSSEQPWQSPYSFMDGNPIWKNDPFGDKVPITGKKKEISAFLKELKNGSGNKYKLDNNNNLTLLKEGVKKKNVSAELGTLVNDAIRANEDIPINLTSKDNTVLFDQLATGKLDVADIKNLRYKELKAGMIGHVFKERTKAATSGSNYAQLIKNPIANSIVLDQLWTSYHPDGLKSEARIVSEITGIPTSIPNETFTGRTYEGQFLYNWDYGNNLRYEFWRTKPILKSGNRVHEPGYNISGTERLFTR